MYLVVYPSLHGKPCYSLSDRAPDFTHGDNRKYRKENYLVMLLTEKGIDEGLTGLRRRVQDGSIMRGGYISAIVNSPVHKCE